MTNEIYLLARKARIEQMLETFLPQSSVQPLRLHQAMRYAVLNGGKRLRPLLVYATGETFRLPLSQLDLAACAIELLHAYSLVHDDLPAMDDDDMRRGQPSCHKQYDEATAILVGDALQALAFSLLSTDNACDPAQQVQLIQSLSQACGSLGMVGGQSLEFELEQTPISLQQLENIHRWKTGALISASVKMGAILANASSMQQEQLLNYANCLGLAFQIQDDILDHATDQTSFSYVTILGIDSAKTRVKELYQQACTQLVCFDDPAPLTYLANYIILPEFQYF